MTLRQTYAFSLRVPSMADLALVGFMRVTGEESDFAAPAGRAFGVQVRVPSAAGDLIPDDWAQWSRIVTISADAAGVLRHEVSTPYVTGRIEATPSAGWAEVRGAGAVAVRFGGKTLTPDVVFAAEIMGQERLESSKTYPRYDIAEEKLRMATSGMKCSELAVVDGQLAMCLYDKDRRPGTLSRLYIEDALVYEARGVETMSWCGGAVWTREKHSRIGLLRGGKIEDGAPVGPREFFVSGVDLGGRIGVWASPAGGEAVLMDAVTGDVIEWARQRGLVVATIFHDGALCWAIGDGPATGIEFQGGGWIRCAASIVFSAWGRSWAGVGGAIYEIRGTKIAPEPLALAEMAKITDALVVDDILYVTGAGPSRLLAVLPSGEITTIKTVANPDPGGAVFSAHLAHRGGVIRWVVSEPSVRRFSVSIAGARDDINPPGNAEPTKPTDSVPTPNKGGDGLYKPESNLWLLQAKNPTNGKALKASDIGACGEYADQAGTKRLKWFVWPADCGALSRKAMDGMNTVASRNAGKEYPSLYHGGRVKCRGAKAMASGSWFVARDIHGQVVARKQIRDRSARQE